VIVVDWLATGCMVIVKKTNYDAKTMLGVYPIDVAQLNAVLNEVGRSISRLL
jgi:hypothetical protein